MEWADMRKKIKRPLTSKKAVTRALNELNKLSSDTAEQIEIRLAKAEYEMSFASKFDRIIINDDLEMAKAETLRVITEYLNRK